MSLAVQIGLVLAGALVVGLVTGATAVASPRPGRARRWGVNWLLLAATLALAALGLPASGWVAGRPALWLEATALMLPVHLAGCALGCVLRRRMA